MFEWFWVSAQSHSKAGRETHHHLAGSRVGLAQKIFEIITWIEGIFMLHYAAVFLVIAIIAAVFGFGGIAAGAAGIAKILFVVFLIGAVVAFLLGPRRV